MQALYSALTLTGSIPAGLLFRLHPRGKIRLRERFGSWDLNLKNCVWLHGASMGEVRGLLPVIRALRERFPELPLLLTATSPTGLSLVEAMRGVSARLLPFDSAVWVRRALESVSPRVLVIAETEIWPALLNECKRRAIPTLLVNARVSDYSYPRYRWCGPLLRPSLECFDSILTTSEISKERFISLGARSDAIEVTGNSKFDVATEEMNDQSVKELARSYFGNTDPVLVLGSIRPGEEQWWFPPIAKELSRGAALNILVAPRHQEKFEYFAKALESSGIPFARRSTGISSRVVLLDSMGELGRAYAIASLAYVGGTLLDFGGHNPLEPAALGVGVVLGPCCKNIADVSDELLREDGAVRINTQAEAAEILRRIIEKDAAFKTMGNHAKAVWSKQRGATAKIVAAITTYCENRGI